VPQPTADIKFAINGREFEFKLVHDNSWPFKDTITCIKEFGCPEPEIIHLMTRVLRPGDFAIDGGANIGFFTIIMSQLVQSNGIVLAVEPGENNLHALKANLAANQINNSELCNRPLWSSNNNVMLHYHEHGGMNSLSDYQPMLGKKELQGITLSTWHTTPRFIKLDIEGAEEHALRGATKHLVNHVPFIAVELNLKALKGLGSSQETMRKFMREWGYSTFLLSPTGGLPALVPDITSIAEQPGRNGTANILFSTVEKVGCAWPEVRI
jgi:FkbM family methyltransferase